MTWVVGGRHLLCVGCVADVEVTLDFPNGTKKPGGYVQKVHKISDDIVIAFADCIRLGFAIVESIRSEFLPKFDQRLLADPELVASELLRFVKYQYKKRRRPRERVELLFFIRPSNCISTDFGLFKCVSPNFVLEQPVEAFDMLEIGSGFLAPEYRDVIQHASKGVVQIQMDEGDEKPTLIIPVGGLGFKWIFASAQDFEVAGISRAMQLMVMDPERVRITDRPRIDEEFPSVATSWAELRSRIQRTGIRVTACVARA